MKLKFILLFVLICVNSWLNTTTYYIKQDGTGDFTTIQEGINAAATYYDTILVYPGIYYENVDFLGRSLTLASLYLITPADSLIDQTIIDGNQQFRCVTIDGCEYGTLDGFTIQNGYGKGYGGGNWENGGAVRIEYGGVIRNCIIKNNSSAYCGGGVYLHHGGNVYNCTIVNNTALYQGGGIHCYDVAGGEVRNCIMYFNSAASNVNWGNNGHPIANCCTTPETAKPTAQNVYADPQFVSSTDYRLKNTSPCINVGYHYCPV